MRPYALVFFYSRRLRVHGGQELFAGLGVAIAVALVFAVLAAAGSITNSAENVVRTVIGPADLQLHARGPEGFSEHLLTDVERLPHVQRAAPLLEQSATIIGPGGRRAIVTVAGAGVRLALMDGLNRTLPAGVVSVDSISLTSAAASTLGISAGQARPEVMVDLRGRAHRLRVSAVLGKEAVGALSEAQAAVMPLYSLQHLAGLPGRVGRILVQSGPGAQAGVHAELERLAGGHIAVAAANQENSLLRQALRSSNQASALFAALAALLGFLFAFNAILLTMPERRAVIADLRLDGTKRSAIVQMVLFQALCLGLAASCVGLLLGYVLARTVFQTSPGYLAQAFTLSSKTTIELTPVLASLAGGVLATVLASLTPLQDLRRGRPVDSALVGSREGDIPWRRRTARAMFALAVGLLLAATVLFTLLPSMALLACALLALATIMAVPLVLSAVLRLAEALARRNGKAITLALAVESLRGRSIRSLALTATGAVALFGSIALSDSEHDLLRGLHGFASAYAADGDVWVVNPGYIPETTTFLPEDHIAQIKQVPGVRSVQTFQNEFMNTPGRRIVIVSRTSGAGAAILQTQTVSGHIRTALTRLGQGGWVAISRQIAEEQHARVGQTIVLPTGSGTTRFRIAALTTNFGWPGGAVLMSTDDYRRLWATSAPSALAVSFQPGTNTTGAQHAVQASLGSNSGLEAITASTWSERFDRLAGEGLGQLGDISTMLVIAAILAMAAALSSNIWQRRASLAELLLDGAPRRRLPRILLTESGLMLSAGCLTGAAMGIYGQFVIDSYLKRVTGFPVIGIATAVRPIEMFAIVILTVLALVSLPGWHASRVSPSLGLSES